MFKSRSLVIIVGLRLLTLPKTSLWQIVSGVIVHWSQIRVLFFIVKHVFYYYDKMSGKQILWKKNA